MAEAQNEDRSPKRLKKPSSLADLVELSEDERRVALIRRIFFPCIPPLLLNRMPQSPDERKLQWEFLGRNRERKEPEFSRGSGAKLGSKHKDRWDETELTAGSRHKRTQRANTALRDRTIFIAGEELVLEDGVDVDVVKSALASIERRKN
jgi:hypothetical protein